MKKKSASSYKQLAFENEIRRVPPANRGAIPVAAVYPHEYAVGMGNLGWQRLLETLHENGLAADRAFLPPDKDLAALKKRGESVRGLETSLPLNEFAALFFSISFEPDYVGLVDLLTASGIAPRRRDRNKHSPLIIVGGIAPTLNPAPIAPFVDLVGIGEVEALLPSLLDLLKSGVNREDFLKQASALAGWYAPDYPPTENIARQHCLIEKPCYPVILSQSAGFANHVDVEISRGCRWRCRFCASGFVVTPYREHSLENLKEALSWALSLRKKVGLVGTDVSDHSQLEKIVHWIWEQGGEVAFPSLRVDALARSDGPAARLLAEKPPRTLTLAVEAASESLRAALGKKLSDEKIFNAVKNASAAGVEQLKVYFLVGVPGETEEELTAISELATELRRCGPKVGLEISVNGLVPKAGTPLQWEPAPDRKYLRDVQEKLRRELPYEGITLNFESPDWTRWQTLLSLGGEDTAEYIMLAANLGWRKALNQASSQVDVLQGRARRAADDLPWQFIEHSASHSLLIEERQHFFQRKYLPPARLV